MMTRTAVMPAVVLESSTAQDITPNVALQFDSPSEEEEEEALRRLRKKSVP